MTDIRIPLAGADIGPAETQAVLDTLTSKRLALGPQLKRFESEVASYVGVRHAVAVNSGTSALHLILLALGIGPGDEVITTSFSFVASSNCILFVGATPVFVDIEPEFLCIDPARIEAAITPRTKAILAVDVFGHPADWGALSEIADRHGLALIEDSAESLGSALNGVRCGGFGDAGIFGFYPNKQITTGEGGMVVTNDESISNQCRSMANQGRGDGDDWLLHVRLGFNFRMDELSAAIGSAQMGRLDEILSARSAVADTYGTAFRGCDAVVLPHADSDASVSWFVYVIRLADAVDASRRDDVLKRLTQRGIGCRNYFAPIHLQPFYRETFGTRPGDLPVTEDVGSRTIALPFFNGLSTEEIHEVAETVKELL